MRESKIVNALIGEENRIIAINLSRDFAEHEDGIEGIYRRFKIRGYYDRERLGIDVYTSALRQDEVPLVLFEGLILKTIINYPGDSDRRSRNIRTPAAIMTLKPANQEAESHFYPDMSGRKLRFHAIEPSEIEGYEGIWNHEWFSILAYGDDSSRKLSAFYADIRSCGVCIYLSGKRENPYQKGGLIIAIPSKLPAEVKENIKDIHLRELELDEAVGRIGIKEAISKSGKSYYSLMPRWIGVDEIMHGERELKTSHRVVFWLIPVDQDKYCSGWYTVEELQQWLLDDGPVCINGRSK